MSVPIFPKNLEDKVIISPLQHLQAESSEYDNFKVPQAVIFCFESYIMNHIAKHYDGETRKFWTCDIHYFTDTKNKVAIVGNFGIGGPASCHLLEILIAAGVKDFIVLGHAGGLQKTNAIGSIVLCEKAIRDEGLSYHYLKQGKYAYASKDLLRD